MFKKPTIQAVIHEQIYEVQRGIIEQSAKVEHARALVKAAEAQQEYLHARLDTLKEQLVRLPLPPEPKSERPPLGFKERVSTLGSADTMHPAGA